MSVPQVVILIRLEDGRPIVTIDAVSDSEAVRLDDWLLRKPALAELVRLAVELQAENGRRFAA
jgi:hypothetical protein